MREGLDLLVDLYPRCFDRVKRRPLALGVREQIITQHAELSRNRIKRLLKRYVQCEVYWSALNAGAARIDLDGKPAGEVTLEDEQYALIQIARAARRAAAETIEDRKAANQARPDTVPVAKCAVQQSPTPAAECQQAEPAPAGPPRLG